MAFVRALADVVMSTGVAVAEAHPGYPAIADRVIPFFPPVDLERFAPHPESAPRSGRRGGSLRQHSSWDASPTSTRRRESSNSCAPSPARAQEQVDARLVLVGAEYSSHADYSTAVRAQMLVEGLVEGQDVVFVGERDDVERQLAGMDVIALAAVLALRRHYHRSPGGDGRWSASRRDGRRGAPRGGRGRPDRIRRPAGRYGCLRRGTRSRPERSGAATTIWDVKRAGSPRLVRRRYVRRHPRSMLTRRRWPDGKVRRVRSTMRSGGTEAEPRLPAVLSTGSPSSWTIRVCWRHDEIDHDDIDPPTRTRRPAHFDRARDRSSRSTGPTGRRGCIASCSRRSSAAHVGPIRSEPRRCVGVVRLRWVRHGRGVPCSCGRRGDEFGPVARRGHAGEGPVGAVRPGDPVDRRGRGAPAVSPTSRSTSWPFTMGCTTWTTRTRVLPRWRASLGGGSS